MSPFQWCCLTLSFWRRLKLTNCEQDLMPKVWDKRLYWKLFQGRIRWFQSTGEWKFHWNHASFDLISKLGSSRHSKALLYHVLDESRYGRVLPWLFLWWDWLLLLPRHFLVDSWWAVFQALISSLECHPHHVSHDPDEAHVTFIV